MDSAFINSEVSMETVVIKVSIEIFTACAEGQYFALKSAEFYAVLH